MGLPEDEEEEEELDMSSEMTNLDFYQISLRTTVHFQQPLVTFFWDMTQRSRLTFVLVYCAPDDSVIYA